MREAAGGEHEYPGGDDEVNDECRHCNPRITAEAEPMIRGNEREYRPPYKDERDDHREHGAEVHCGNRDELDRRGDGLHITSMTRVSGVDRTDRCE